MLCRVLLRYDEVFMLYAQEPRHWGGRVMKHVTVWGDMPSLPESCAFGFACTPRPEEHHLAIIPYRVAAVQWRVGRSLVYSVPK